MVDPKPPEKALKVLYLEDNPHDRTLVASTLAREFLDAVFTFARNREEFETALSQLRFDLILSDFTLPTFNGMDALALARVAQPDTPFLFFSGTIGEARAVESLKSGAVDYVLKDSIGRLGSSIRRALREAEERAMRTEAEMRLRAAQKRLTDVLAKSPAIIYVLKVRGQSVTTDWVSENIEPLLGYSVAEALEPDWWFSRVHPEDQPAAGALGDVLSRKPWAEYRFRRKDGQYRWIRDEQRLVRNESGAPVEIVGSWMDITDRKQLEEQLRQAQKMEAIGQLAGGVAHDFNNMLAVIGGNSELALMDAAQLSPTVVDCLKQVSAASERAASLTRQLLTFSRRQVMQAKALDLNKLVADLTRMLSRIIGENVRLQCTYAENLPRVHADPGMLEQVLVNLVVNARDAMPNGGRLRIATGPVNFSHAYSQTHPEARPGDFVSLTVQDSGTGIAAEHLSHIFEPFFTTKEAGKGTGLGLATVYGIVKQHQGWVEVTSAVGRGATFRVLLPALSVPAESGASEETDMPLRGGQETILLLEDEPAVRLVTRRLLESVGYKVLEAGSSFEALELFQSAARDCALLLTDIVLAEGVTGMELADRLRVRHPALKVIYMSGYSGDMAGKDTRFFKRTKSRFLQKPFDSRTLTQTVRDLLDEPALGSGLGRLPT